MTQTAVSFFRVLSPSQYQLASVVNLVNDKEKTEGLTAQWGKKTFEYAIQFLDMISKFHYSKEIIKLSIF